MKFTSTIISLGLVAGAYSQISIPTSVPIIGNPNTLLTGLTGTGSSTATGAMTTGTKTSSGSSSMTTGSASKSTPSNASQSLSSFLSSVLNPSGSQTTGTMSTGTSTGAAAPTGQGRYIAPVMGLVAAVAML